MRHIAIARITYVTYTLYFIINSIGFLYFKSESNFTIFIFTAKTYVFEILGESLAS